MSFRTHRSLAFSILIASSLLLAYTPSAAAATVSISVSIQGLPSEFQTMMTLDGVQQGTILGGSTKSFKVDSEKSHVFQVDAEIKGQCASYEGKAVCSRYKCLNNVWNLNVISTQTCEIVPLCDKEVYVCDWRGCYWQPYCTYEQKCWTTGELSEKGHMFEYATEHQVVVSDIHGQNVDNWTRDGSNLSLAASEFVILRDDSDVKERDIFQAWIVNGAPIQGRNLPLRVDKPYYVKAEYQTVTKFRVRVSTEYGNSTMNSPDGWYVESQEATVSVEKELPLEGFWGMLGGKRLFVAWKGPGGTESKEATYSFAVNEPTSLNAEWTSDFSTPTLWLGASAVVFVALVALIILYRSGLIFQEKETGDEPTELDKAKAETEEPRSGVEHLEETRDARKKEAIAQKRNKPECPQDTQMLTAEGVRLLELRWRVLSS